MIRRGYYIIFLGNKLYQTITDDMNSEKSWAKSGMVLESKTKAERFIKSLKGYNLETDSEKFNVVKLSKII